MKMNKYGRIILPMSVLLIAFASCATAPLPPMVEVEPVEEPAPVKKEPVTVTETVYLVAEESSFFSDGVLDERKEYRYREEGTELLESILYDARGNVVERSTAEWEKGLMVSLSTINAAGDLLSVHRYQYDQGNMSADLLFNEKEELQTRLEWEYDDRGRKTRWNIYNGGGALLAYTLYRYEGDTPVRIENYSPAGDLEELFVTEYENGLPVKTTRYDADDNVDSYTTMRYESGVLVEELVHRASGAVRRKTVYENDAEGNPVKLIHLDSSNNVLETVTRTYTSRTVTRTVEQE